MKCPVCKKPIQSHSVEEAKRCASGVAESQPPNVVYTHDGAVGAHTFTLVTGENYTYRNMSVDYASALFALETGKKKNERDDNLPRLQEDSRTDGDNSGGEPGVSTVQD